MSDALKRKQMWMKKLEDLKVEGLLALRDVVLATSIEHMAGVDICKMNLDSDQNECTSLLQCLLLRLRKLLLHFKRTDYTLTPIVNYLQS